MNKVKNNVGFTLQYSLRWSDGTEIDLRKQTGLKFDLYLPDDTTIRITAVGYDAFKNKVWVRVPANHTATAGVYKGQLSVMTKDLQLVTTGLKEIVEVDPAAQAGYKNISLVFDVTSIDTPANIGQGYSPKIVDGQWVVYDDAKKAYVPTGQSVIAKESVDAFLAEAGEDLSNQLSTQAATFEANEAQRDAKVDDTVSKLQNEEYNNIEYFESVVTQQDKIDGDSILQKGQMLKSDVIVCNQANIGIKPTFKEDEDFNYIGDETSCTDYRYIFWGEVQSAENQYNFSAIRDILYSNLNSENRMRTNLRLFVSTMTSNQKCTKTITYNGNSYYTEMPLFLANYIINNGQVAFYGNHLLLDVNLQYVKDQWQNLWSAFSNWFNTTYIHDNKTNTDILAKDLVLYIDLGFLGPWGEGKSYDLKYTCTSDFLVDYVRIALNSVKDKQINIGQSVSVIKENSSESYKIGNELFYKGKQLSNDAGYVGFFSDNIGSRNPAFYDEHQIVDGVSSRNFYKQIGERGDFFTGEFATFAEDRYWKGGCGLWALNTFNMFKASHIRVANLTYAISDKTYKIKDVSRSTYKLIGQALSSVGFRYVLSVIAKEKIDNTVNVEFEIANIGLNRCFFDIYKMYYVIKNLSNGTVTEIPIDYDLRLLKPESSPMVYMVGTGKIFKLQRNIDYECEISLIIKDKLGIQNPLYLSNYDRQENGSYILYTDKPAEYKLKPGTYHVDTKGEFIEIKTDKNGAIYDKKKAENFSFVGNTTQIVSDIEIDESNSMERVGDFEMKFSGSHANNSAIVVLGSNVRYATEGLIKEKVRDGAWLLNDGASGKIVFNSKYDITLLQRSASGFSPINDIILDLSELKYLTKIQYVSIGDCNGVTGNIDAVKPLYNLIQFIAWGCRQITGDIKCFSNKKYLTWINVSNCPNIDGNIGNLKNIPKIGNIQLTGSNVAGGDITYLISVIVSEGTRTDKLDISGSAGFFVIYKNNKYTLSSAGTISIKFNGSNEPEITGNIDIE